jgi:hypothetical protein
MVSKKKVTGKASPVDNLFTWTLYMIRDEIIAACSAGRSYTLDGFGTWAPAMQPDGNVEVQFSPDEALINGLNDPANYNALAAYDGMSGAELVEQWNKDHPENPVPSWITLLDPE